MSGKAFDPIPEPFVETDPPAQRVNPRPDPPDKDPSLEALAIPERSLVEDLGADVDDLRQLYTDFGLRPYRLFSVITRWTGGEKGRGDQAVQSETEILPTPRVRRVDRLRGELGAGGLDERGLIRVDQISPRLTEDDIRVLFHVQPLETNQEAFLELRIDNRDGNSVRRRFVVKGVPFRRAEKFDWVVDLLDQQPTRSRAGALQRPRRTGT